MQDRRQETELRRHQGLAYRRATKDRQDLRGTVYLYHAGGEEIERKVPGFPPIKRVYRLREGVRRLFGKDAFRAEEKMDGYNVRIFKHSGRLLAASRGGFICPFTTEWSEIWGDRDNLHAFFHQCPGHTLCCEVLGDNPYNQQRDPELPPGAHLFVFAIIGPDHRFLSGRQRDELVRRFGLPCVPVLGMFDLEHIEDLYRELRDLNRRGREGVVLKSLDAKRCMKFVTPESDLDDLRSAMQIGFDLSSGFLFNRYLRATLFVKELGLDRDEYARRIGEAFLDGAPDPESFDESSERYVIYVQRQETWDQLRQLLGRQVLLRRDGAEPCRLYGRDMLKIRFRRIYQKSTHRYRRILNGHLHQD